MTMTRVIILGSTGSIGRQTLDVIDAMGGDLEVAGLAARRDVQTLAAQVQRYRPRIVAVTDPDAAEKLRAQVRSSVEVLTGPDALSHLAAAGEAELVLVAVVGIAGLLPTLSALRAGRDVALANKETLAAGGALVMEEVRRTGRRLMPIDSEHVAIAQCLRGEAMSTVRRIVLTGSGGPFLRRPLTSLADVRPEEALAHPIWKMGKKITIDSATLMNKGLEVIEARWLFDLDPARIDVVLHPQSIVHSMVEFVDGSVKAQLAPPDMRLVIAYALRGPDRVPWPTASLEWDRLSLTFERPQPERYPCLAYAYDALQAGGTMPAVLNAANETAVELFLTGRIGFLDIATLVRRTMDAHRAVSHPGIDDILAADAWAREQALALRQGSLRPGSGQAGQARPLR